MFPHCSSINHPVVFQSTSDLHFIPTRMYICMYINAVNHFVGNIWKLYHIIKTTSLHEFQLQKLRKCMSQMPLYTTSKRLGMKPLLITGKAITATKLGKLIFALRLSTYFFFKWRAVLLLDRHPSKAKDSSISYH